MSNDHYWLIHIDDLQDGLGLGSEDFVPLFSQKWEYWVAFEYKHYKELPAIFSSVIEGKDIKIKVGKCPPKQNCIFPTIRFGRPVAFRF